MADSLRLERSIRGRPRSVSDTRAVKKEPVPDSRYASFPTLRTETKVRRRSRTLASSAQWLRIGFYSVFAALIYFICSPATKTYLPESERQLLVTAAHVADVTRAFTLEASVESYQKSSHWSGSSAYLYEYHSSDPEQPRVASLVERQEGLVQRFSRSSLGGILQDFDWRTHSADLRGLVDMKHGVELGDQSESYFLYEADRAVGNCITVRMGNSKLSVVIGGVVLRDGREVERVLRPALENLRALESR